MEKSKSFACCNMQNKYTIECSDYLNHDAQIILHERIIIDPAQGRGG